MKYKAQQRLLLSLGRCLVIETFENATAFITRMKKMITSTSGYELNRIRVYVKV
jgi:hypothetical protein